MPVTNAVARTRSIPPYALSGDGDFWSGWADGSKPGTGPVVYFADTTSGPTGTNGTQTPNNLGCPLSLYGKNFGNFADYVSGVNVVTIGGVAVPGSCFLHLSPTVGSGLNDGHGVYETLGLMELCFQVGSLPTLTNGTACNITVTVNGRSLLNRNTAGQFYDYRSGAAITFMPQPGKMLFVDPVGGNNANPGTLESPLKDVQTTDVVGGALPCASAATGAGALTGSKPGTFVCVIPGAYNNIGSWGPTDSSDVRLPNTPAATLNRGFVLYVFRLTGCAPTGAVNTGPLHLTRWPCAAGANTPGHVSFTALDATSSTSSAGAGGIFGNDNARSSAAGGETNPYDGLPGWGRFLHISNMAFISSNFGPRDASPINWGSSSDDWICSNLELQFPSQQPAAVIGHNGNAAKGACMTGNGLRILTGAIWGHNVTNGDGANQNHGLYPDGSTACAKSCWFTYSCYEDIPGGNGVNQYNGQASDVFTSNYYHGLRIKTVNKHGINIADNTRTTYVWDCEVIDSGESSFRCNSAQVTSSGGLSVFNCTLVDWDRVFHSGTRPAIWNDGGTGAGGSVVFTNIVAQRRLGATGTGGFFSGDASNSVLASQFFDELGGLTSGSVPSGTGNAWGDAKFNNGAANDFTLQSISPCVGNGVSPPMVRYTDFGGLQVPNTSPDRGCHQFGGHL